MDKVEAMILVLGGLLLLGVGVMLGSSALNRTWKAEIVSRGYGEWVPSKEDPTRNVFAWKENKKEN